MGPHQEAKETAMGKTGKTKAAEAETPESSVEERFQDIEIKLAYVEKELDEYKEANRELFRKLTDAEDEIRKLWKEIPDLDLPTPEISWDSDNRDVRP
jgi:uncharacterized coiled-coil protein SlyX